MFWHAGIVDVVYFVGWTRSTEQSAVVVFVARIFKVEPRVIWIDDENVITPLTPAIPSQIYRRSLVLNLLQLLTLLLLLVPVPMPLLDHNSNIKLYILHSNMKFYIILRLYFVLLTNFLFR